MNSPRKGHLIFTFTLNQSIHYYRGCPVSHYSFSDVNEAYRNDALIFFLRLKTSHILVERGHRKKFKHFSLLFVSIHA